MPTDEHGLTPKQRQFCDEYLIDKNATQAAIRAGYSAHTAQEQGSRLLSNVMVAAYLKEKQQTVAEKLGITHEYVLGGVKKIAETASIPGEHFNPAAANKSYELLGKHINTFPDKVELTGKNGGPLAVNIVRFTAAAEDG